MTVTFGQVVEAWKNRPEAFGENGYISSKWVEWEKEFGALLDTLKKQDLEVIPAWLAFVDSYPFCREHGALLCVNVERTIWRCTECHKGIDYEKPELVKEVSI